MSRRDGELELTGGLRARLESAASGEPFDAESALTELQRIEKTNNLLRRVSLDSFGEFEHRIHELSLLARVGQVFVAVFDLERMSHALLEVVVEALPCENAYLYLFESAERLELKAMVGPAPAADHLEAAEEVASAAAISSEARCVRAAAPGSSPSAGERCVAKRSHIACPVVAMGESLGAIVLSDSGQAGFSQDQARVVRPIADLAALAVRHARACAENIEHQQSLEALVEERTREVNEARAVLSRHEQAAAMGKLAASIAHQVNNPMSYLVSNLERALEYTRSIEESLPLFLDLLEAALQLSDGGDDGVRRAKRLAERVDEAHAREDLSVVATDFGALIAEAKEGVDRIQRVGDDLRGFAQGIGGVMEFVDVNRLVETALHVVRSEAKDRIDFRCRLGILPTVRCQQYQITQVLLNLLENAVEAIDGEGEVQVTTRAVGRWVEVEIADEGPGIPPDQVDRVFEPFLTTKLTGSGLGLSISRDIVTRHRGRLYVQSSPEGTVLTLRLAVSGAESAPLPSEAS